MVSDVQHVLLNFEEGDLEDLAQASFVFCPRVSCFAHLLDSVNSAILDGENAEGCIGLGPAATKRLTYVYSPLNSNPNAERMEKNFERRGSEELVCNTYHKWAKLDVNTSENAWCSWYGRETLLRSCLRA